MAARRGIGHPTSQCDGLGWYSLARRLPKLALSTRVDFTFQCREHEKQREMFTVFSHTSPAIEIVESFIQDEFVS